MRCKLGLCSILFAVASTAFAESAPPAADVVLAENAYAKLTVRDYETELLRLPPESREAFAADPKRVAGLLDNLLLMKSLATLARNSGIDKEPDTHQRIALETERILAQLELQRIETEAGKEFDSKIDQYTSRAQELYRIDQKKYQIPPQVSVSHILFDTKTRGPEAALAAANEARAKLLAGADFAAMAREVSDDTGTKASGGRLDYFGEGRMDPEFTKAAFALAKPGDISEPVRSRFGYHLIKLEGRKPARQQPFDEVKPKILAELRADYVTNTREAKVLPVRRNAATKVNDAAIEKLVTRPPAAPIPAPK